MTCPIVESTKYSVFLMFSNWKTPKFPTMHNLKLSVEEFKYFVDFTKIRACTVDNLGLILS